MKSVPSDKTVVPSSCVQVHRIIFSVDQNEGKSDKFNYSAHLTVRGNPTNNTVTNQVNIFRYRVSIEGVPLLFSLVTYLCFLSQANNKFRTIKITYQYEGLNYKSGGAAFHVSGRNTHMKRRHYPFTYFI
jgi:hypothetical protein